MAIITETPAAAQHTPIPWTLEGEFIYGESGENLIRVADTTIADDDEEFISEEEAEANAQHIVRCVNAHDKLVAWLETLLLHVFHYESMTHAHPNAARNAANARAFLGTLEGGAK